MLKTQTAKFVLSQTAPYFISHLRNLWEDSRSLTCSISGPSFFVFERISKSGSAPGRPHIIRHAIGHGVSGRMLRRCRDTERRRRNGRTATARTNCEFPAIMEATAADNAIVIEMNVAISVSSFSDFLSLIRTMAMHLLLSTQFGVHSPTVARPPYESGQLSFFFPCYVTRC